MPPVSAQHYTTPARVWQLGLPIKTLFGADSNIAPGSVGVPMRIAGTGTGVVMAEGNPHDSYPDLRAKCISAGSVNQRGQINPGQLPVFQLSDDGGVSWGNAMQVTADEDTAFIDDITRGIRWKFTGSTPAFLVGDIWQTSAAPSPDIVAWIGVSSSQANKFLLGSFKLPLVTWSEDLEMVIAWLVRWQLVCKRGLSKDQAMQQYRPDQPLTLEARGTGMPGWADFTAQGWLLAAQRGDFADDPDFGNAGKAVLYPDFVEPALAEPGYGTRMWTP